MAAGGTDPGRGSSSGSDEDGRRAVPRRSRAWRRWAAAAVASVLAAGLAVPVSAGPAWAQNPTPSVDYDADDDGLIEVSSLAQLNAIRWDLDGDGAADVYPPDRDGRTGHDPDGATKLAAAFPNATAGMGCPSDGCSGYELVADLDFDTNANGQADAGDAYWNGGKGWDPLIGGEAIYDGEAQRRFSDEVGSKYYGDRPNPRARMFTGIFEGNGRTIANLFIDDPDRWFVGLFGYIGPGGHVRNVGLSAPNPDSRVRAAWRVGALAGALEKGRVSGVWSDLDVSGSYGVGGLVGSSRRYGFVVESYATGDVTGVKFVGGLVGMLVDAGAAASYATGDVTTTGCLGGGLAGMRPGGNVRATYATGSVTGTGASCVFDGVRVTAVGGLFGWMHWLRPWPHANYAIGQITVPSAARGVGGLAGGLTHPTGPSAVGSNYWDVETTGRATNANSGVGYTTAQLQAPTGYAGIYADWNVDVNVEVYNGNFDGPADDPWDFGTSSQYPVLKYCADKPGIATADGEPYCPLDPARQRAGGITIEVVPDTADDDSGDGDAAPQGYTVDPGVVAKVEYLASQTHHGSAHVNRWQRVLAAFGVLDAAGVAGGAMTAVQAQQMADAHSSPVWDEVVAELTALEAAQAPTPDGTPPPTDTSTPQDAPVPDGDAVPVTVPVVSIAAGPDVVEGSDVVFTLSADPPPTASLDVAVTVSTAGDWSAAAGPQTVTLAADAASATFTVSTVGDSVDEADGSVSVTLDAPGADAGYEVAAVHGTAAVGVADDDVDPLTVYMIFFATSIDENGTGYDNQAGLNIGLTRTLRSWETLTVPLSVTGGDEGTNWTMRNLNDPDAVFANDFEVVFGPGDQRVELALTAVADSDWADHEITVSYGTASRAATLNGSTDGVNMGISWGPDGTERADGSTTVVIVDSDDPSPEHAIAACTGKPRVSVADAAAQRGDDLEFVISLSCRSADAVTVYYLVGYGADLSSVRTVDIASGDTDATVSVPTIGVSANIKFHVVYTIGAANYSAHAEAIITN